jgi:putative PIN family toxin of toxin-antitoxin system
VTGSPVRIVVDTNVLVSGLLFGGVPGRLIELGGQGRLRIVATHALLQEYIRVLAYPKFKLTKAEIRGLLDEVILPLVEAVRVDEAPAVISADPSDDKFLAAAVAGSADAVVSGDRHLLALRAYRGIPIETAAELIRRVRV